MFAKRYKFLFFYTLFVLVLMFIVSKLLNPNSLTIRNHNFLNPYPKTQFFTLNEPEDYPPVKKIYQFRQNEKRQGFKEIDFDPDLIQEFSDGPGEAPNFGAHTASKSSPAETDNFIVVVGDYGLIQVFNKKTLELHWRLELFDSKSGMHGTPIGYDDLVFIGDYSGKLYFLNLLNKEIIWVIDLGGGLGATPLFDGKHLYVNVELTAPVNGYITKIDPFKKEIIWISEFIGQQSHSSPAVTDKELFFGDNNGDFYSMSKETGEVIWRKFIGKPVKSTPALYKDTVLFTSWNGFLFSLDQKTGGLLWTVTLSDINQSSPAVIEEKGLGIVNSQFGIHILDLDKGKESKFLKMRMGRLARKASPVAVKYKDKYRALTSCGRKHLCIVDMEALKIVKKIELPFGFSNEVGLFKESVVVLTDQGPNMFLYEIKR
jgi:outer membrane protein assembly factor BamB